LSKISYFLAESTTLIGKNDVIRVR